MVGSTEKSSLLQMLEELDARPSQVPSVMIRVRKRER